eukprot:scaffold13895_cov68-Phaeocystis_antarctica.AAC.7
MWRALCAERSTKRALAASLSAGRKGFCYRKLYVSEWSRILPPSRSTANSRSANVRSHLQTRQHPHDRRLSAAASCPLACDVQPPVSLTCTARDRAPGHPACEQSARQATKSPEAHVLSAVCAQG